MKNFLINSIVNEINQELLFITYNYQSDFLTVEKIKEFDSSDYSNLEKSKELAKMGELLEDFLVRKGIYTFDLEVVDLIKKHEYNFENLKRIIEYINPYVKEYKKGYLELEKYVSKIIDEKMKYSSFKGEYPTYILVNDNNCKIERILLSTNARSILYNETSKFAFKITYMDYDVPIKDYSFKGKDLRNLNKEEIFKLMDSSVKVNLNNSKYYDSTPIIFLENDNNFEAPDKDTITLKIDHKIKTYGGVKAALKDSLKRTGFTILVLIAITILVFVIKYFS